MCGGGCVHAWVCVCLSEIVSQRGIKTGHAPHHPEWSEPYLLELFSTETRQNTGRQVTGGNGKLVTTSNSPTVCASLMVSSTSTLERTDYWSNQILNSKWIIFVWQFRYLPLINVTHDRLFCLQFRSWLKVAFQVAGPIITGSIWPFQKVRVSYWLEGPGPASQMYNCHHPIQLTG